jgi:hypothetical protein
MRHYPPENFPGASMNLAARIALFSAAALAATAHAADWRPLADTAVGMLSVDAASMKPQGAQTAFQYRIDFKAPQKNPGTGKAYRSTVSDVLVACKEKTLAMTQLVAYADVEGKGAAVDRVSIAKPVQGAISAGSSDELLWKAACPAAASATPAPAAAPKAKK